MAFTPRRLADGRICCSSETALCEKCKRHHNATESVLTSTRRLLETEADAEQAGRLQRDMPPDPYAEGLARMRVATQHPERLEPSTDPRYQPHGVPADPYLLAIAANSEDAAARYLGVREDNDAHLRAMSDFRRKVYDMADTAARAANVPATSDVHLAPPDSYEKALELLRQGYQR